MIVVIRGFYRERQIRYFSFTDLLSDVDARRLFSLEVVDEIFYGVLIFNSVIWMPLDKDDVFELSDVALETRFLRGVGVPLSISDSDLAGTGTSLLLHLGLVTRGDAFDIDSFFIIILRQLPSYSYSL